MDGQIRFREIKNQCDELIVFASREEIYDRESIIDADSGITEQSKIFVSRKRI